MIDIGVQFPSSIMHNPNKKKVRFAGHHFENFDIIEIDVKKQQMINQLRRDMTQVKHTAKKYKKAVKRNLTIDATLINSALELAN